jgi:MFS family permease
MRASEVSSASTTAAVGKKDATLRYLSSLLWVYSLSGKRRRIFPGWWEVLVASAHSFFGYGFYLYSWSVIQALLQKEFGWTATAISVVGVITKEDTAVEGPIIGWLIDHFGPVWSAAGGWFVAGIGFLLLPLISLVNGAVWWMWLCYGGLVVMGMNSALYTTSYKAVNRWFIKNRGLAIGATSWGAGFGSPILIPVTAALAATHGWRPTVIFLGILFIAMGVTSAVTLFRRHGPEAHGLLPDT